VCARPESNLPYAALIRRTEAGPSAEWFDATLQCCSHSETSSMGAAVWVVVRTQARATPTAASVSLRRLPGMFTGRSRLLSAKGGCGLGAATADGALWLMWCWELGLDSSGPARSPTLATTARRTSDRATTPVERPYDVNVLRSTLQLQANAREQSGGGGGGGSWVSSRGERGLEEKAESSGCRATRTSLVDRQRAVAFADEARGMYAPWWSWRKFSLREDAGIATTRVVHGAVF
jgi:hypothetical protein